MADATLNRIRILEKELAETKLDLKHVTQQRDEAIAANEGLVYTNIQMAHHKNEPSAYHVQEYLATKLTGDRTPAKGQVGRLI